MNNITFKSNITLEDYAKLRASVGWPAILPEQAKFGIDGSRFVLVAYDGESAVSIGRVVSDGGYVCYLADVIVLPEYQNQGIGSEIVSRLITMVNEDMKPGFQTHFALISAKGREDFYERFGFAKRPTDIFGHGMAQWLTKE
jgi:GNAT superfamily N-acetyltransferase